uniref:Uncharacterized protein n=1 Tax=Anopheles atroparvus TaxID=41427 RepID=A0A182IS77_ANOAO
MCFGSSLLLLLLLLLLVADSLFGISPGFWSATSDLSTVPPPSPISPSTLRNCHVSAFPFSDAPLGHGCLLSGAIFTKPRNPVRRKQSETEFFMKILGAIVAQDDDILRCRCRQFVRDSPAIG